MSDTQQRIDALVKSSDILLFMKGSASFPMCGFSGRAIQILKACGVDPKARDHRQRAGRRRNPPGHQGIQQLAHHPAAVRQGRVHWRLGHHDGDVRIGRTQAAARHMTLTQSLLIIGLLIAASAFFRWPKFRWLPHAACACARWPTRVMHAPTGCCACRSSQGTTSPWCRSGKTQWPFWAASWAKAR
jgi:hypothetical protein